MTCGDDSSDTGIALLVHPTTPFFHFDLAAAVRAAESDMKRSSSASYGTFDDDVKTKE